MRGYRWATEESSFADMQRMVPKTMSACYAMIENNMLRGPWVMGEQYTICDPYLFTLVQWMEGDSVNRADFPRIGDHYARMMARDSVRRALAIETAS
jgi:glutathione S-transferase